MENWKHHNICWFSLDDGAIARRSNLTRLTLLIQCIAFAPLFYDSVWFALQKSIYIAKNMAFNLEFIIPEPLPPPINIIFLLFPHTCSTTDKQNKNRKVKKKKWFNLLHNAKQKKHTDEKQQDSPIVFLTILKFNLFKSAKQKSFCFLWYFVVFSV